MIKENNLDWTKIPASGKDGRINKEDVLKYINKLDKNFQSILSTNDDVIVTKKEEIKEKIKESSQKPATSSAINKDKITKITGFRKAMTKSMTNANKIPSLLYSDEFNVDRLIELRHEINSKHHKDAKMSFMPFIIKAVSLALKEFPELNSIVNQNLNDEGYIHEFTIKENHNISIAIDGPEGLVVPNIKQVQNKSIRDIQNDLNALKDKATNRSLTAEDFAEGSFSISNIGNIGGKQLGPIIMPPQACIIGISKMFDSVKIVHRDSHHDEDIIKNSKVSYLQDNQNIGVAFHKTLNFCISADHRIIDGAYVAKFSKRIGELIQDPIRILVG